VKAWTQQVDDLGAKIRLWTGNVAGILDISPVDLDRMQINSEVILDSWQREGIFLAGEDRVHEASEDFAIIPQEVLACRPHSRQSHERTDVGPGIPSMATSYAGASE